MLIDLDAIRTRNALTRSWNSLFDPCDCGGLERVEDCVNDIDALLSYIDDLLHPVVPRNIWRTVTSVEARNVKTQLEPESEQGNFLQKPDTLGLTDSSK